MQLPIVLSYTNAVGVRIIVLDNTGLFEEFADHDKLRPQRHFARRNIHLAVSDVSYVLEQVMLTK